MSRGLGAVMAGMLLAGCAGLPETRPVSPEYRAQAEQAQVDVYFVPGTAVLANGEVARLRAFLGAQVLRAADDVIVDVPSSGVAVVDAQRGHAVRAAVGAVPARVRLRGRFGFVTTEARPDAVFVQVLRYDRVTIDCANGGIRGAVFAPVTPVGCANAINRARMASQLRDLTAPRALGTARAAGQVDAVRRAEAGGARLAPISISGN